MSTAIFNSQFSTFNYYYALGDATKNITEYIDSTGTVQAHYEYSPFGKITKQTGTMQDNFDYRFSSELFDNATGLVYYNFRYYSPELGRWLSRDPIEEEGGYNLYGMVNNNPVSWWDELGLGDWQTAGGNVKYRGPEIHGSQNGNKHIHVKINGKPYARQILSGGRQIPHGKGINANVPKKALRRIFDSIRARGKTLSGFGSILSVIGEVFDLFNVSNDDLNDSLLAKGLLGLLPNPMPYRKNRCYGNIM